MVHLAGLEPTTFWAETRYSNPTELQVHLFCLRTLTIKIRVVDPAGFEPATKGLRVPCSTTELQIH